MTERGHAGPDPPALAGSASANHRAAATGPGSPVAGRRRRSPGLLPVIDPPSQHGRYGLFPFGPLKFAPGPHEGAGSVDSEYGDGTAASLVVGEESGLAGAVVGDLALGETDGVAGAVPPANWMREPCWSDQKYGTVRTRWRVRPASRLVTATRGCSVAEVQCSALLPPTRATSPTATTWGRAVAQPSSHSTPSCS